MQNRFLFRALAPLIILAGTAVFLRLLGFDPYMAGALPTPGREKLIEVGAGGIPGRAVIVAVDFLQISDLKGGLSPNITSLAERGAIALMNANTGRGITPENTYATIGAGSHALSAANYSSQGFSAAEGLGCGTAADEYRRRMGIDPPAGSLLFLDIAGMRRMNESLDYTVVPGAMGEKLHEAGFRTAALGNADDVQGPKRQVLSMVMDSKGIVDTGSVGSGVMRSDGKFPGGIGTDYSGLLAEYQKLPPEVRLAAIDLGDLARLQGARQYMDEGYWKAMRTKSIQQADGFLGALVKRMDLNKDLLILVAPTPGDDGKSRDRMPPVIMCGGNIPPGLLLSPTTKRPGILMNVDIAPTILQFLDIPGGTVFTGRPAEVAPGQFGVSAIAGMHRAIDLVYQSRPYLQKGYVIYQLILLGVSLGFIFIRKKGKDLLKPFFLTVMAVPLSYLLMPFLPLAGALAACLTLILVTVLLTCSFINWGRVLNADPFLLVSLATVLAIAGDLLAGAPLQKVAIMSYDPVVGARFYGLGNEYMGVLIGSALVGTAILIQSPGRWRRGQLIVLSGIIYAFMVYVIASPQLGTNVGGTIAAATAFLVTFLLLGGASITWRPALAVAALVTLMVFSLSLYDSARPVQCQSHIGRAATQVMSGGINEVINIISRKSEINIKLIKYTIWSRIFVASLGMLALLFYRPPGAMEGLRKRRPYLFKGLVGVIIGSIVAFIFNDSGVVAAATALIFGIPPLIYLVLEEMEGIQAGQV